MVIEYKLSKVLQGWQVFVLLLLLVFPVVYLSNYYISIELVSDPTIPSYLTALYSGLLE